ncbi:hypothetical protein K466DRAFT_585407 [Polyporus arcularius HHB13444]|uniref:Velvet domain-containing protein n=1 Tax=Polyporus arcularius HHB13444 TaxID=1314778 RepID=A0A5C3PH65_9APHY|nr:hypothetical protein K466DRAFT_585407 [Polyporus arcularius HHB13444]
MSLRPDQGPYAVPLSVGPSTVGGPIYFTHGPFAGKTVRTSAAEIQKADIGRKFARKDKRPLDPPPVVQVRFFEVIQAGTPRQYEQEILDYDDTLTLGLVCQADLFPVVVEAGFDGNTQERAMSHFFTPSPFASTTSGPPPFPLLLPVSFAMPTPGPVPGWLEPGTPASTWDNSDIVAYYGNYPITESTNSTSILAGARIATPVAICHHNREALAFVFSDLAVRQEGTFTLRYTISDVYTRTTADDGLSYRIPVLASCFGGVFRIWSTKTFPGLSGSTTLTKHLSLSGAPVNVRATDHRIGKGRKKQKTGRSESSADDAASSPQSQPESSEIASSPDGLAGLSQDSQWAPTPGYPWLLKRPPGPFQGGDQL